MINIITDLLLTVIIPVYNIEPWLDRCIKSLLPAIPKETELLLVTGKSSDESNTKCMQWEKSDNRIKVLQQHGTGLADARNCGVAHSRGEYLLYIDGDDFVDTTHLQWLLEKLPRIDRRIQVIMTDYRMIDMTGKVIEEINQIGSSTIFSESQEIVAEFLRKKKCFWNVWRYIYRRDFLLENHIFFRVNTLGEDMDYTAKVYAAHPHFAFAHCPFYQYCVGRGSSLMDQPTMKRLADTISNIQHGIFCVTEHPAPYMAAFVAQYQFEYFLNIALCVEIPRADRVDAYALYRSTQSILYVGQDSVIRMLRNIMRWCPIPLISHSAHWLKMLRRTVKGNYRISIAKKRSK